MNENLQFCQAILNKKEFKNSDNLRNEPHGSLRWFGMNAYDLVFIIKGHLIYEFISYKDLKEQDVLIFGDKLNDAIKIQSKNKITK